MKKKQITVLIISLLLVGCASLQKTPPPEKSLPEGGEKLSLETSPQGGGVDQERYFYYLAAQQYAATGDLDRAIVNLEKVILLDPENGYLQRELATYYLQQQNSKAALKILEALLGKHPEDPDTLFLYGMASESIGGKEKARTAYEKLISVDPKRETAFLRLGNLYLEGNDTENAYRVYSRLVEAFPYSYVGHFFLGKIHAFRKEYDQAESYFQKTLSLAPDLDEPRYELADVYKEKGETDKAIAMYQAMFEANPKDFLVAIELAELYRAADLSDQAGQVLARAGAQCYNDPSFFRLMGQEYLDEDRNDEAVTILEGMLKGAPDISSLSYILGLALEGRGDKGEAILRYRQVADPSKFYAPAIIQAAILYQEMGQTDSAVGLIKTALEKRPDTPELYLYLGMFHEEKNRLDDAVKAFQEGLRRNGKDVQLHFRMGVVLDKLGNRDGSIEQMKTVLGIDPKHVNALNYLGYTYADMNINLDEAETLIKNALVNKPDDGYITDSLGWVFFKKGDLDQALECLEKAVRLVPDDPTILEHLGDVYLKLKQEKKALGFYQRSLSLKRDDKAALENKINSLVKKGDPAVMQRFVSKGGKVCLLILAALLLSRCGMRRELPVSSPEALSRLQEIRSVNETIDTLKGMGQIKVRQEKSLASFRAAFVGKRPDHFRLEILAVTGQPVLSFASDGNRFYLLSHSDEKLYQKKADEKGLGQFLPVSLTPEEILDLLCGRLPLSKDGHAHLTDGALVVESRNTVDLVPLTEDGFLTMERRDRKGSLLFTLRVEKTRTVDGKILPQLLTLSDSEGVLLQLTVETYWLNQAVPEDRFVLKGS